MPIKFKILMTFLALGALFSVYSLTNSLKSNINATIPRALSVNLPSGLEEDADHDGLSNTAESYWATEWQNSDTDGDGFLDGEEVLSGHDPRVPGPDDLLAKTNGFIKSGSDENLTEKLSSLITAGLYAGDLQKTAPTQTYESAINNLGLSVIDNGYAALNPSLENTATVSDSRENQEKYLSEVIDILENKLMNGFLFTPYKLSVFSQKLISSDPQKVKTISVELLSEAMNFQNNAEIMKKISVPASWKEIHLELLGSIRSLALSFQAMSYFDQDPMKAIVAIRNIEDIYSNAPKLLAKIAQKAKTNKLQILNSKFLDLINSIANEL